MPYKLYKDDDDIVHVAWIGDIDGETVRAYLEEVEPYLAQATPDRLIHAVIDSSRDGKYTAEARRYFADLSKDPRLGRIALINSSRTTRLMAKFFIKVSRREDVMRFFDGEEEAVTWLKEERRKTEMF